MKIFKERNLWCLRQRQKRWGFQRGECNSPLWSPAARVSRAGEIKFKKQSRSLAAELFKQIGILLLTSGFAFGAVAGPCHLMVPGMISGNTFNGPAACGQGKMQGAVFNGPLVMKGTTVTENLKINGPGTLRKVQVKGSIFINGSLTLLDSQVNMLKIHGPLYAKDSKIQGDMDIASTYMKLDNTSTKNIVVDNKSDWSQSDVKVYLLNKTIVNGNIKFIGKKGTVYIEKNTKITGKIINGMRKQD